MSSIRCRSNQSFRLNGFDCVYFMSRYVDVPNNEKKKMSKFFFLIYRFIGTVDDGDGGSAFEV